MSTWNLPPGVTTNDEHINPADIPSSKEHGGQLASLDPAQQRAMLRAHRIARLREALDVCREEREERNAVVPVVGPTVYNPHRADFALCAEYLEACIATLAGEAWVR